jgi:hypothetical protein
MKKLIIATSILFAFSATFAQEGKPSKKTPMSSKAPTSVSANEAKPNMKPNVKPVGKTSTKPSPVVSKVSPVKGVKPVGPSSNRAAASSKVNTARPEKDTGKGSTVNTRAASSKVNTARPEKDTGKGSTVNTRAASSKVNTARPEKDTGKGSTVNTRAAASAVATGKEIERKKPDADYCKGWKEGYIKAFAKATGEKISSADVPNCVAKGDCEGYKCGYAAGVKNAERRIK